MNKLKKILHWLIVPPKPYYYFIILVSFLLLGIMVALNFLDNPAAYLVDLASAYSLYLLIRLCIIPALHFLKKLLCHNKYISMYFNDIYIRSRVSLYTSTAFNLMYAVFKLVTGITYASSWITAIAVYYLALFGIKFILVDRDRKNIKQNSEPDLLNEWKSYRLTGKWLFLLNSTVSGIIIQVIQHDETYSYPQVLIFVYAAYAFYQFISALVRLIKARKVKTPLFREITAIDFSVAVTAMFTLQTAMLSGFSESDFDKSIFTVPTGTCVSLIISGIAVFMIVNARRNLKNKA